MNSKIAFHIIEKHYKDAKNTTHVSDPLKAYTENHLILTNTLRK